MARDPRQPRNAPRPAWRRRLRQAWLSLRTCHATSEVVAERLQTQALREGPATANNPNLSLARNAPASRPRRSPCAPPFSGACATRPRGTAPAVEDGTKLRHDLASELARWRLMPREPRSAPTRTSQGDGSPTPTTKSMTEDRAHATAMLRPHGAHYRCRPRAALALAARSLRPGGPRSPSKTLITPPRWARRHRISSSHMSALLHPKGGWLCLRLHPILSRETHKPINDNDLNPATAPHELLALAPALLARARARRPPAVANAPPFRHVGNPPACPAGARPPAWCQS